MEENMEALAGVTAESMAAEAAVSTPDITFAKAAEGLAKTPYLALTSDDGLAPDTDALVAAIQARGSGKVATAHVATDHSWSDHRIELEAIVINWLSTLP
jgi:hypothetical protein